MGEVVRGLLFPSTPSSLEPDGAVTASQPVIRGLRALAEEVARLRPDAIVIASAHWVTTFQHYVSGATRLAGILSATEVPGESRNLPYDYPGDPELAWALVAAGVAAGVPAVVTTECTLPLDSGTVIPLRYVTPASDVPIVPISLCQLADLGEMLRWGRAIGAAVRAGQKRVVLAVSSALPHRRVRGPEPGCRGPDERMRDLFAAGDQVSLETSLGEVARDASVEAGGRHLALLLGALGSGSRGRVLDYGRFPGRGNAVVPLSSN